MSSESDVFDQIRLFLPKYLTPQQTRDLYSELSKFPENKSFYLYNADLQKQMLQGDGWRGFIVIDFATGARKSVSSVILSNSCDISLDNPTDLPVNVLFAPLIDLQKYIIRLRNIGKTDLQIESIIRDIRKQRVTSFFYLPECQGVIQESIIALDDIHAHPLQDFLSREPTPLFTLNQYAFYVFLIKLSIHFSRFQEGISRFNDAA